MLLHKQLIAKSRWLDTQKHSILDVWRGSEYAFVEKQGTRKVCKKNSWRCYVKCKSTWYAFSMILANVLLRSVRLNILNYFCLKTFVQLFWTNRLVLSNLSRRYFIFNDLFVIIYSSDNLFYTRTLKLLPYILTVRKWKYENTLICKYFSTVFLTDTLFNNWPKVIKWSKLCKKRNSNLFILLVDFFFI